MNKSTMIYIMYPNLTITKTLWLYAALFLDCKQARSWSLPQETWHSQLMLPMVMLHSTLVITVFFNLVTNKNSSVTSRKDSLLSCSFNFHFQYFWFGFIGADCQLQGGFKLCTLFFYYISAHWYHHTLQHWVELWWPSFHAIWLVFGFCFYHACCTFNGWNLFSFSNFWWSLLLECQTCWLQMGTFCLLDYWLVFYKAHSLSLSLCP